MANKKMTQVAMQYAENIISELENDLTYILQIGISSNYCVENDGSLILLDNKPICYPKGTYQMNNIIQFDPFSNKKLANFLFQRYCSIFTYEQEVEIMSYYIYNSKKEPGKIKVIAKTEYGDTLESRDFVNEAIAFIDLILILDNQELSSQDMEIIDQYETYLHNMTTK